MIAMARVKPEKPYPQFPLFAHGNGMWAKRIRGQVRYFGKWSDPGSLSKIPRPEGCPLRRPRADARRSR